MFVRENQAEDATPGLVRVARRHFQSGRSVLDISTIAIVISEQIAEKIALTLILFANS
jgi:predicted secreted protein